MAETYQESRLWENDSSLMIAASPRVYDSQRIHLKLAVGYKLASTVHGLPSLEAPYFEDFDDDEMRDLGREPGREDDAVSDPDILGTRTMRRRPLWWDLTPAEFDRLSENEQREVLRERYVRRRIQELRMRKTRLAREPRLEDVGQRLLSQVDRLGLGWGGLFGAVGVAAVSFARFFGWP
ncbi:Type II secretion system (T2SS)-associated protein Gcp5 [Andalucia godoyi]|uniref:Type II secretion system (T2SS)-associated protein Gcp5 n=1 Tax=Andalucia godoyi TaxID=505711 RepID=A0A8K0F2R2_ANDGO|nr:Type II secretion system (T2SS)-associated protein Gcp5 [Andalucia godoyi]|eukprot:ANDGO_03582.mRNA.1 Type II secretion system (T2SS)-associated protein Gcp5